MRLAAIAFTERGWKLASRACRALDGWDCEAARGFGEGKRPLAAWVAEAFADADALLFVGALGIAVRAIAPHVRSKAHDPAVVVMDEGGTWCISLLSGHLGGANRLAEQLGRAVGATPVITTASDVRGVWSPDGWAHDVGLAVVEPGRVKGVSARLLAGDVVTVYLDGVLEGELPRGLEHVDARDQAQVILSPVVHTGEKALHLVPPSVTVGVGCRRGIAAAAVGRAVEAALAQADVPRAAVASAASIELKRDEEGLAGWAEAWGLPLAFYGVDELASVEGSVSSSPFVEQVCGVDNVCERAALADSGTLIAPKRAQDGVTVALACRTWTYSFEEEA